MRPTAVKADRKWAATSAAAAVGAAAAAAAAEADAVVAATTHPRMVATATADGMTKHYSVFAAAADSSSTASISTISA